MRKADLVTQFDSMAFADSKNRGGPLADTIECKDGRFFVGTWEEGTGGVTFMVIHENQRTPESVQLALKPTLQEQLVFEIGRERQREAAKPVRGMCGVGFEQTLKLEDRTIVEGDAVEVAHLQAGLLKARPDSALGK